MIAHGLSGRALINEDSIFLEALQKGSAEARAAFLDQACAGNAELRGSVDQLLRAHERADEVLPLAGHHISSCTGLLSANVQESPKPYTVAELG